jgi:hypothetical protein
MLQGTSTAVSAPSRPTNTAAAPIAGRDASRPQPIAAPRREIGKHGTSGQQGVGAENGHVEGGGRGTSSIPVAERPTVSGSEKKRVVRSLNFIFCIKPNLDRIAADRMFISVSHPPYVFLFTTP